MTQAGPTGDPGSCHAAAADLATCARWLREGAETDPARADLAGRVEDLRAVLTDLGIALSRSQFVMSVDTGPDRVRESAVSQLGRARARLRRVCETITTGPSDGAEPATPAVPVPSAPATPPSVNRR